MARETWSHTGTSNHATAGFTGFAGVAKHLNETFGGGVTRQLVWTWYHRRATTAFPEKRPVSSGSRDLQLFDVTEVATWYRSHRLGDQQLASLVQQDPQ